MSELTAASACPICGIETPHSHDLFDVERWATAQVARWGYVASLKTAEKRRAEREQDWDAGYQAGREDSGYDGANHHQNPHRTAEMAEAARRARVGRAVRRFTAGSMTLHSQGAPESEATEIPLTLVDIERDR